MKLKIPANDPAFCYLEGATESEVQRVKNSLTYVNTSLQFQYRKFKKSGNWYAYKFGEEAFAAKLEEMKDACKKTLLADGKFPAGVAKKISDEFRAPIVNEVEYPESKLIPWAQKPPELRDYQLKIVESMLANRHCAISAATGTGKSLAIIGLCKELGLKTLVMTPSTSITNQLYKQFETYFGKKYSGLFSGAKKQTNKLFTIATAQSLARVEPGSEHWENLSKIDVFISDESHQTAAATLSDVCMGLAAKAPYRFFFSATQTRSDGQELLLDSIIGPIVFQMDVTDGTDLGVLAKPRFRILQVNSHIDYMPADPNECTRKHLFYADSIVREVANVVNSCVAKGLPTVVLVKEIEQFSKLLPHLKHEPDFAFGSLTDENKSLVPESYWKSTPDECVAKFNAGDSKLLVGTTCISTGTDIKPVRALVYWQGGKSEVQVKQAIGRGTRVVPGKTDFYVFDFDVVNSPTLHRHSKDRIYHYKTLSDDIETIVV